MQAQLAASIINQAQTRMHEGREYLVLPAVALVTGVHNGLYYPAKELAKFPEAWNGRPVSVGHPKDWSGNPTSCNTPSIIEGQVVGQMWNTRWDGKRLLTEIWIDMGKAQKLNSSVLAKLQAGIPMEVSTGLYLETSGGSGVFDGEPYTAVAGSYRPDHLALLPDELGACSWADGCGVPRLNQTSRSGEMRANQMDFYSPMPPVLLADGKTSTRQIAPSLGINGALCGKVPHEKLAIIQRIVSNKSNKLTAEQLGKLNIEILKGIEASMSQSSCSPMPAVFLINNQNQDNREDWWRMPSVLL